MVSNLLLMREVGKMRKKSNERGHELQSLFQIKGRAGVTIRGAERPYLSESRHGRHAAISRACLIWLMLICAVDYAEDWPPVLDRQNVVIQSQDGRRIERYTHGARADWGYRHSAASEWAYHSGQESTRLACIIQCAVKKALIHSGS